MGCVQSLLAVDPDLSEEYDLVKSLGRGVEGEVWLGVHKITGAQVAIKLVQRGADLGLGPEKVRREIQLQARLSHVNIVELKQLVLTRRHLGIVMSYEEGGDLHQYCQKFKMDEGTARYFFIQIVLALEYCHRNRIAHRDLKLANFLLTAEKPMTVKLTDFGCAGKWDKKAPPKKMGRMKTFVGTPAYMAPQVLESAFYPTHTYSALEADVWSLGILLCHMFFGRHTPYWMEPNSLRGEAATMQARVHAMKDTNWAETDPKLREGAQHISAELRDLLDKIFVADESKRITIEGIKGHPWYTGPLHPALSASLKQQEEEQAVRDGLRRATVSTTAMSHDTQNMAGEFQMIDLLVDMAQKHRRMPAGTEHVYTLDMAHMADGPLSMANTDDEADHSVHMLLTGGGSRSGHDRSVRGGPRRDKSVHGGSVHGGSRHVVMARKKSTSVHGAMQSIESCLNKPATAADRAASATAGLYAGLAQGPDGGAADQPMEEMTVPTTVGSSIGFTKTLSLHHMPSGLVLASYQLEPSVHGGNANSVHGGKANTLNATN